MSPSPPRPSPLFIPELFSLIAFYVLCDGQVDYHPHSYNKYTSPQQQPSVQGVGVGADHDQTRLHLEHKSRLEQGQPQGQHPRGLRSSTPKRQQQRHTPGSNLVACAQVCKFWSAQLLPLLWHSIRMNESEQVDSIFLSSFSSRPLHPSATHSIPRSPSTSSLLDRHNAWPFCSTTLSPYFLDKPSGPVPSQSEQQTASFLFQGNPEPPSFVATPNSTYPPSCTSYSVFPASPWTTIPHPHSAQPSISAGIASNGHLIRQLYISQSQSVHLFDHPAVSQLTDLSCVQLPNMGNQQHAENIATHNLKQQLKRLEISRPSTSRENRHPHGQCSSDSSLILHDVPMKQAESVAGSTEHHTRALCRRSLSPSSASSSASLRSHSIRSLAYRTHRVGWHGANTIHERMHRQKKRVPYGHRRHGYDYHLRPHLRQRTFYLSPRAPCAPSLPSRNRQFSQSSPYSLSSASLSSDHRRGSIPNCSQGSRGQFQSDDDTHNSRNPFLYGISDHDVQPLHLIHLALLQYEFRMDEWVEMMRSMPALQELDMEISSFLLQDQQNMMASVGQVERTTGRLRQHYTSHGDFKLELDDENGSDHDKDFDHVLKPKSFSTDNAVGRTPLQQRHRLISPHSISAGSNASPDQTQGSQRTGQGVVGVVNSAINNQVRQIGYQQARLKEEAMLALPFLPFHFPSVRYLTFRGVNIVPELVGFFPNLESLAFEESPSETPADPATIEDLPGDDDATEAAAGSSDETLELLTDMISDRCPRITRLVLNESSLVDNIQHLLRIPALLRAIPRLHCFAVSVQMIIRNQEIIPALLQSHRGHLQSFVILNDQEKQPDEATSSHQSSYYPPEQQAHGIANLEAARLRRQCLQVFESCPNLQVSDCKIALPLQEIMLSIPNWPCRVTLRVLRLQIQELTGDGGMDMEEAAVTEMFIKSIFLGSRSSSSNTSSSFSPTTALSSMPSEALDTPSTSSSSVGSFIASPAPLLSSSESGKTSLSPASLPGSTPSAVTLNKPSRIFSFHSSHSSMSPSPSPLSQGKTTPTSPTLSSIPPLPSPPTPGVPSVFPSCSSHQIKAVGQLVAIQYLVEHQLATMPYLEQFYLGDTMISAPRRG